MTRALLFPEGITNEPLVLTRAMASAEAFGREHQLQRLAYEHPEIIPIEEIDPGAGAVAPLCRELTLRGQTGPVFLDMLGVTRRGRLVLVECKLWRNPQARREVIGQVLEYAGLMRRLSYGDLSALVATRIGRQASNLLWELARDRLSLTDEAAFVDAVSESLSAGAFDLVVLGDGIRSEIEAVRGFLEAAAGLRSRLALVEVAAWTNPSGQILLTPQIALRTKVIEQQALPYTASPPPAVATAPVSGDTPREAPTLSSAPTASANRQFWDRFIATAQFSHPDQPPPSHGGNNWVRLALPSASMTLYREKGPQGPSSRCGMFLRLRGEAGRAAYDTLCAELPDIEAETGMRIGASWKDDADSGTMSVDALVSIDEEAQLAWLAHTSDRLVSAFRPRLSALG
ncbi:hypothetical protein ASG52_24300 [Methylobacterium sp. Leaf456]|uniref:hypothetical protein n=1 Tax=Methylobacterium sp. Leaf456 TaxID=1736382 RepID=UPI0006F3B66A|nr:hypothetical protein [Methylobacterium sp. Leaf456]KQT56126.1 hypothetical protein ASG52_24300 [Methylobacterium sp. Leaf456]